MRIDSAFDHLGFNHRQRRSRCEIQRKAEVRSRIRDRIMPQQRAMTCCLGDQSVEFLLRCFRRQTLEREPELLPVGSRRGERLAPRFAQKFRFLDLVRHFETRRHIGFEGKEVQQPFAKAVDGVNLQTARRFDRASKEAPRED